MLFALLILAALGAGLYIASIFVSPAVAHAFFIKPIAVSSLSKPQAGDDRLIIPKLGVDIGYTAGASALTEGAQWHEPRQGNPSDGGAMILAAHRLHVQPTPQHTVARSPFYALYTLRGGDKLIIDYQGVRYGYEVTRVRTGAATEVPVPTDHTDRQLVLYTYDSDHDTQRTVVFARPLGKVAL